jgi:hypothetical protein
MEPRVCPHYPDCGCGIQSGPHTCEWEEVLFCSVCKCKTWHRGMHVICEWEDGHGTSLSASKNCK